MATCPVCGKKHRKLRFVKCWDCGKDGCSLTWADLVGNRSGWVHRSGSETEAMECCIYYGGKEERDPIIRIPEFVSQTHRGCQAEGAKILLERAEERLSGRFESVNSHGDAANAENEALLLYGSPYKQLLNAAKIFRKFAPFRDPSLMEKALEAEKKALEEEKKAEQRKQQDMEHAKYLERVFRMEEAAEIYETYEMPDEAGRVRRMGRTTMTVDLNTLLEKVRAGGIVASYKCPDCGGGIEIKGDTRSEGLRFCKYCGVKIETMGLGEFLKKVIGQ